MPSSSNVVCGKCTCETEILAAKPESKLFSGNKDNNWRCILSLIFGLFQVPLGSNVARAALKFTLWMCWPEMYDPHVQYHAALQELDFLIEELRNRRLTVEEISSNTVLQDLTENLCLRRQQGNFDVGHAPTPSTVFMLAYVILTGHPEILYYDEIPSPTPTPPASDGEDDDVGIEPVLQSPAECHVS